MSEGRSCLQDCETRFEIYLEVDPTVDVIFVESGLCQSMDVPLSDD